MSTRMITLVLFGKTNMEVMAISINIRLAK